MPLTPFFLDRRTNIDDFLPDKRYRMRGNVCDTKFSQILRMKSHLRTLISKIFPIDAHLLCSSLSHVTVPVMPQAIDPPRHKNKEYKHDKDRGTCPTTSPSLSAATAKGTSLLCILCCTSTFVPPLQSRFLDARGIRAHNSKSWSIPPSYCTSTILKH